jgi:hypothetical protein
MHRHGRSYRRGREVTHVVSQHYWHLTTTTTDSRRNVFGTTRSARHGLGRSRRIVQRRFSTQKISHPGTLERILDGTLGGEMVSLTDTTGDLLGSELSFEFGVLVLLGFGLGVGQRADKSARVSTDSVEG